MQKLVKIGMLLFVPFIFIFDMMAFLSTNTTAGCLAFTCIQDFFRNSSLTLYTINEAMKAMRK